MAITVLKDFEIKQVFRSKLKFKIQPFMVFYQISTKKTQYAITISRTLTTKAVERNLIKRQMRSLILNNFNSQSGIKIIFLVLKDYFKFNFSELQTKIIDIFDKISKLQSPKI